MRSFLSLRRRVLAMVPPRPGAFCPELFCSSRPGFPAPKRETDHTARPRFFRLLTMIPSPPSCPASPEGSEARRLNRTVLETDRVKTCAAIHWLIGARQERNLCLDAALSADCWKVLARPLSRCYSTIVSRGSRCSSTRLTAPGLVGQVPGGVKLLLSRRPHELGSTIAALQSLVPK